MIILKAGNLYEQKRNRFASKDRQKTSFLHHNLIKQESVFTVTTFCYEGYLLTLFKGPPNIKRCQFYV